MNNELYQILKKINIHPKSYKKIGKVYLINETYIIKLNTNNYDIYKFLISKGFNYFPESYNTINDNYDLVKYIIPLNIDNSVKINDYLKIISILHFKTSYKREIDLDEIKGKYEEFINEIRNLREYYLNINDVIDREMFLSPDNYLLVRNISLIYSILNISEKLLNKLYDKLKNSKSIRVALLHNNLSLDHLIINDGEYLISWDNSLFDSPIYELNNFYRNYYEYININDFLSIYENYNKLDEIEKNMLIIMLSIPKKIEYTNNNYLNTKIINKEIKYLKSVYEFLIKLKE